jgi:hypothetical protein
MLARRQICPVVPPQKPAKRPQTAHLTAKLAFLRSLKIPAKTGCGRGVPGVLRRSRKSGNFVPELEDLAACMGGYTGDFS